MEHRENRFSEMTLAFSGLEKQNEAIDKAAHVLAEAAQRGALIHVFGVDARAADIEGELFFRPGCFACVNPVYDPAFANSHGAYRSELCRPLDGLTARILEYYEYMEPGEPLLLLAFDADSIALRQAAEWAKSHGLAVITILPGKPSREKTRSLFDTAIYLGPSYSTLLMTAALDELMARAVALAPEADIWKGKDFPDLEINAAVIERYLWRVRHL
ncbi:MAG: SIS domain-containing protein [Clostridiaceae bacterium]